MSEEVSYPSEDDFSSIFPSEDGLDDWEDVFEKATGKSIYDVNNGSRFLGWPDVIQNSMFVECDLVTRGYYLGNGWRNVPKKTFAKKQKKLPTTNGDCSCNLTQ